MSKKLFIIVLALLLLLTGCTVQTEPGQTGAENPFNSPEPMPGYEADNRYFCFRNVSVRVQEAGDILFGTSGFYMKYYDMASGVSGVLCADPSCTHDSTSCGAYVADSGSICYYDGKRYWVSTDPQEVEADYFLLCSELSGENQEKVKRIDFDKVILAYQPQMYFIHRGKLYFLGRADAYEDGKVGWRVSLMCSPLDDTEEFTPVFDEFRERDADIVVRFVRNSIYCAVSEFPTYEIETGSIAVTRYDLETGAAETVFEESGCLESTFEFWVTEDETIYLGGTVWPEYATLWRVENGEKVEIVMRRENEPDLSFAGDVAFFVTVLDGQKWIEVFTLSGEQLYEGPMYPEPIEGMEDDPNDCGWSLPGGDGDEGKIIIHLETDNNPRQEYTVLLDATNGMKGTLLWSNS